MRFWSLFLFVVGCSQDHQIKPAATTEPDTDADADSDADTDADSATLDTGTPDTTPNTGSPSPVDGRWEGDCTSTSSNILGVEVALDLTESAGAVHGTGQMVAYENWSPHRPDRNDLHLHDVGRGPGHV